MSRALFRRRTPWTICGLTVEPDPSPVPIEDPLAFEIAVGAVPVRLSLPANLVHRLLAMVDPAAPAATGAAIAILLELALEPSLAALEKLLPKRGSSAMDPGPAGQGLHDGEIQLGFMCCDEDGRFAASLALNPPAQAVLLSLLETNTARAPRLPVSLMLSIRTGAADLHAKDIRVLQCGDVIVPWEGDLAGNVTCVAADHLCWSGTSRNGQVTLTTAAALLPRAGKEGFGMNAAAKNGQGEALADASLDELPVRVVFEVGRVELTLADLSAMLPGYIIPLGREAGSPVDILANGRRIGQGEVVAVGDSLGIRVLRLASAG